MSVSKASEVASAVNVIIALGSEDQQALLEVIEDYFTQSDESQPDADSDGDDDLDGGDDVIMNGECDMNDSDDGESAELVNTEDRVREAMLRATDNVLLIESLPTDAEEQQTMSEFMTAGCGCSKANGKPCFEQFSREYITSHRASCAELTRTELDVVILGALSACINTSYTVSTQAKHKEALRERAYTSFTYLTKPVCSMTFQMLHNIGKKRLVNLMKSLKENGLAPRIHGNTHQRPKHALTFKSTEYVVRFLLSYAEQNALLLPGRVPEYSRSDIQLLPSSSSKWAIWRVYRALAEMKAQIHPVAYTTFCLLWRTLSPSIIVMKPRSDLCWQCQQNSAAIVRTANLSEAEKLSTIAAALEHLRFVKMERKHYKTTCKECEESVRSHYTTDGKFTPPLPASCIPHNSQPIKVHYSFDYAQQVHYPSDAEQPGPIYFLTPSKCTIFGVNCEALPRQVNFLTDEAGDCGKGANAVVSHLHYFFDHHGLGEKDVYLHADNCTGQNKNNCMVHYFLWRVLTGRHTNITFSFLVVGHTKFAPDRCFGLLKRQYRRSKVGSLKSIANVVNSSAQCNHAQLVSREDGSIIVETYNWTDFFATKMKIPGIKKLHHFRFSSSSPGVVFVKERSDSQEVQVKLLKEEWNVENDILPTVVPPIGLNPARQWYLYEQIWPFCPSEDQDTVCPLPSVPKPGGSRAATPAPEVRADEDETPPPPKRRRSCGICNGEGHDRQTCPQK